MLKINNFLYKLQNLLLLILFLATISMFYIKYSMFNISKNISHIDKKIEKLKINKNLLIIELTYLTSTERILYLIDKNPDILNDKDIITISQLKTKNELINISLAKFMNNISKNKNIAKSKNIIYLIEREI